MWQEDLEDEGKLKSTVRMRADEREVLFSRFGGIQAAIDHVIKEAQEEEEWIPELPKRLVPAYRAIRDIALLTESHIIDSGKLRETIANASDCAKRTAMNRLRELKERYLLYTFGSVGDEYYHFIACNAFDKNTIWNIKHNVKMDWKEYFEKKYGKWKE